MRNVIEEEKLVDFKKLCEITGLSYWWFYTRIKSVPHIRCGKVYRFRVSEVMEWLEKQQA